MKRYIYKLIAVFALFSGTVHAETLKVDIDSQTSVLAVRVITGFQTGCSPYSTKLTYSWPDIQIDGAVASLNLMKDKDTFANGYGHVVKRLSEKLDAETFAIVRRALTPFTNDLPDPRQPICQAEMPVVGQVYIPVQGFAGQTIVINSSDSWIKVDIKQLKDSL